MTFEQYQNTKHFPALDGIRGISILLVLTVHLYYSNFSWTWLSGASGVQLFFVLSGFLITLLAIREENKNGSLNLKAFYIRRSFRIFPLYFLVLGLYSVLILVVGFGGEYDKSRFVAALPYYLLYINEYAPGAPFYQSWSLGIEEKFYLLWPFLAFILFSKAHQSRAFVTLFLIIVFLLLHNVVPSIGLIHYHSILIGCLLAIAIEHRATFEKVRVLGSGYYPIVLFVFFVANQLAIEPFPVTRYFYPFIAGMWLLSAILSPQAFLTWKPLTYIGERAYGIYLVHILCIRSVKFLFPSSTTSWWISFLGFLSASVLSILVAEILYRLVEAPCIKIGRKLARNEMFQMAPSIFKQNLETNEQ